MLTLKQAAAPNKQYIKIITIGAKMKGETIKKIVAREWLKLLSGLVFGFIAVIPFFYLYIHTKEYRSETTLGEFYKIAFEDIFLSGLEKLLVGLGVILIPYFI